MEPKGIIEQAEAIAQGAKRIYLDRLARSCENSNDATVRSLADLYRRLNFGSF